MSRIPTTCGLSKSPFNADIDTIKKGAPAPFFLYAKIVKGAVMFKLSDIPVDSGAVIRIPAAGQRAMVEAFRSSREEPVIAKLAATVLLLRESTEAPSGFETFMMKRAKTMKFVPDAVVFPGGSVRVDDDGEIAWAGPTPEMWAKRLGVDASVARSIVVAAARELFEECGVLLASRDGESPIETVTDAEFWLNARRTLEAHELSFSELLSSCGLELRSDFLHARSRWTTPEYQPRRYDTFFFAARLPQGQTAHLMTSEATLSDWVDSQWVLEEGDAGRLHVVPPTVYNLKSCVSAGSLDALMEQEPPIDRVMFRPVGEGDEMRLECVLP